MKEGDWIKADIIGMGFYEIVGMSDVHLNVKCLRIFNGKNPEYRDHVTNITHGYDKITGERIPLNMDYWNSIIVKRRTKQLNK